VATSDGTETELQNTQAQYTGRQNDRMRNRGTQATRARLSRRDAADADDCYSRSAFVWRGAARHSVAFSVQVRREARREAESKRTVASSGAGSARLELE
jgi:hypothetical protein